MVGPPERDYDKDVLDSLGVEVVNKPQSSPESSIREDFEMLFRCGMQFMRYLAKKYGFTIKQWPEK